MRNKNLINRYASTTDYEKLPDPSGLNAFDSLAEFASDTALSLIQREPIWADDLSIQIERSFQDKTRLSLSGKRRLSTRVMGLLNLRLFERLLPSDSDFEEYVKDNQLYKHLGVEESEENYSEKLKAKKVNFFARGASKHIWSAIERDRDEYGDDYEVELDKDEIAQDFFSRIISRLNLEIYGVLSKASASAISDEKTVQEEIDMRKEAVRNIVRDRFNEAIKNDQILASLEQDKKQKVLDTLESISVHHFLDQITENVEREVEESPYEISWVDNFFKLLVKKDYHYIELARQMSRRKKESDIDESVRILVQSLPIYMEESGRKGQSIKKWAKSRLDAQLGSLSDEIFEYSAQKSVDYRHGSNRSKRIEDLPHISEEVVGTFEDTIDRLVDGLIKRSLSLQVFDVMTHRALGSSKTKALVKDLKKIAYRGALKSFSVSDKGEELAEMIIRKGKYGDRHMEDYYDFEDEL